MSNKPLDHFMHVASQVESGDMVKMGGDLVVAALGRIKVLEDLVEATLNLNQVEADLPIIVRQSWRRLLTDILAVEVEFTAVGLTIGDILEGTELETRIAMALEE